MYFFKELKDLVLDRMDSIAQSMGIDPDDTSRLKGALFVVTRDFCYQTGDTYLMAGSVNYTSATITRVMPKLLNRTR